MDDDKPITRAKRPGMSSQPKPMEPYKRGSKSISSRLILAYDGLDEPGIPDFAPFDDSSIRHSTWVLHFQATQGTLLH
jgi:hypothetical protein